MNLVNQFLVYLAPKLLGGARTALGGIGVESMPDAKNLSIESVTTLGTDLLIVANPIPSET
jgi:diaminohydroxyphosphoribosylaminopyrimidine deaminase/5-amino-6-(5-phosphoribosylamino)uracil reductase